MEHKDCSKEKATGIVSALFLSNCLRKKADLRRFYSKAFLQTSGYFEQTASKFILLSLKKFIAE